MCTLAGTHKLFRKSGKAGRSLTNHLTLSKSLHLPRPQVPICDLHSPSAPPPLPIQKCLAQEINLGRGGVEQRKNFLKNLLTGVPKGLLVWRAQATTPVSMAGIRRQALGSLSWLGSALQPVCAFKRYKVCSTQGYVFPFSLPGSSLSTLSFRMHLEAPKNARPPPLHLHSTRRGPQPPHPLQDLLSASTVQAL